jgi:flagellin-like hook-associated protein FlgL
MMNLTAANIMTEAATAMLAQAMQLPTGVLNLLK